VYRHRKQTLGSLVFLKPSVFVVLWNPSSGRASSPPNEVTRRPDGYPRSSASTPRTSRWKESTSGGLNRWESFIPIRRSSSGNSTAHSLLTPILDVYPTRGIPVSYWSSRVPPNSFYYSVPSSRRAPPSAIVRPCRRRVLSSLLASAIPPVGWPCSSNPMRVIGHAIFMLKLVSGDRRCTAAVLAQSNCLTGTLPRWQLTWPGPASQCLRLAVLRLEKLFPVN
jgi:hypothetical protein